MLWASRQDLEIHHQVDHLDINQIQSGDQVFGTLPVNLVEEVCTRNARYFHLSLVVPEHLRMIELSADQMDALGAKFEEYIVNRPERSK